MAVYWMTFRIAADARYDERYDALVEAINQASTQWWIEATSFILFESALKIDAVAKIVSKEILADRDLVLIGMTEFKTARVIGKVDDQDLFDLMPFTKKV